MTLGIALDAVVGSEAILEVDCVDGGDGAFAVVGMTVFYVGGQAEGEVADGVVECEAVL